MIIDKKRICFYCYSPAKDSGHIKGLIRLSKEIKKNKKYRTFLILNSRYDILNKELTAFDSVLFLKSGDNFSKIMDFIDGNKPGIFITEFFPFGRTKAREEIVPILKILKSKKIPIISALPIPYFTHRENNLNELERDINYYEKIIIFTPPKDIKYFASSIEFENRIKSETFINFFKKIRKKLHFIGYPIDDCDEDIKEEKNSILVTNGAGSVLKKIIDSSIIAKKELSKDINMTIICGISVKDKDFERWNNIIRKFNIKNIKIKKYVKNLIPYIRKNEIIISSAGSTSYEILRYSKKAILIPYEGKPNREHSDQLARSIMLKELIKADIIREKDLTVKTLIKAVNKKLREENTKYLSDYDFNGKENFVKIIKSL